jgi:hypothetical protein
MLLRAFIGQNSTSIILWENKFTSTTTPFLGVPTNSKPFEEGLSAI